MAVASSAIPFGLREVALRELTNGTPGSSVFLPAGRTFSFSEEVDSEELRGNDAIVATHDSTPRVNWDLEGGGISLEAWAILAGGTVTTTGVSPNEVKTLAKEGVDSRPEFEVEGRAISDSGGDFHIKVYRCKATGAVEGELSEGTFFLTGASGTGIPHSSSDKLYDLIHNETATVLT